MAQKALFRSRPRNDVAADFRGGIAPHSTPSPISMADGFGREDVTEPPHRLYQCRPSGIWFDLPSQARDLGIDRAIENLPRAASGLIHEKVARQDAAGIGDEYGQ